MQQRVSMITLPVNDVPAARGFYERLGWTVTATDGDIVMFQAGGMILSLWWREKLDLDGGVADRGG
jgi:predicted lactoylglutathione lyase